MKPIDIVDINEINIEPIQDLAKNAVFNKNDQGRKVKPN